MDEDGGLRVTQNRRCVLFLATDTIVIKEWLPVAGRLHHESGLMARFLVGSESIGPWEKVLALNGHSLRKLPESSGRLWTVLGRVPGLSFFECLYRYWACVQEAGRILHEESPAGIVILSDRLLGWPTAFVKEANTRGIPSFIISAAFPAAPGAEAVIRQRATNFRGRHSLKPLLNRWAAKLFPKWAYQYNGVPTLLYTLQESLAAKFMGIMPENPWAFGGGAAGTMLVESQKARDIFGAAGTPLEKMIITGRPTMDAVVERMARRDGLGAEVRRRYGIPHDHKILLCSVPHLKEHRLLSPLAHEQEMEFLFSTFGSLKGTTTLLNLHPGCLRDEYEKAAQRHGLRLCENGEDIYGLIPICDIYVSSYSTTVNVAMGCLRPTVIVDFYRLNFSTYDDCGGVAVIRKHEDLGRILESLLSDSPAAKKMREAQDRESGRWVLADGKNSERTVQEMLRVIRQTKREAA